METGTVFTNNRTQAVRLPAGTRFPDSVKKVQVRAVGKERILTPVDAAWDEHKGTGKLFTFTSTPAIHLTNAFNPHPSIPAEVAHVTHCPHAQTR